MVRTNENNKGLSMMSLIIVVILLMILSFITITSITEQDILPKTLNAEIEYNGMVANQYNQMEGDKVLNILDLDE